MPRRPPGTMVAAFAGLGFLAAIVATAQPGDPSTRLRGRYRLADLIAEQQADVEALRAEAAKLRDEVQALSAPDRPAGTSAGKAAAPAAADVDALRERIAALEVVAGLRPERGPGLRITLDDSPTREPPPGGNVNDLVVHSQDVQAAVNAAWRAGATAVSINGQRLIATSAVLCVGNTLLLNGTVHSPPYVISAVSATRDRFDSDRLVKRLRAAAASTGLRFSVERATDLEVPAYRGTTTPAFAAPVVPPPPTTTTVAPATTSTSARAASPAASRRGR